MIAAMPSIFKRLLNTTEHKRSTHWMRLRGAASTGKKAKRAIHREERRQTKIQIRQALDSI